jgi:hypothetical protein
MLIDSAEVDWDHPIHPEEGKIYQIKITEKLLNQIKEGAQPDASMGRN